MTNAIARYADGATIEEETIDLLLLRVLDSDTVKANGLPDTVEANTVTLNQNQLRMRYARRRPPT